MLRSQPKLSQSGPQQNLHRCLATHNSFSSRRLHAPAQAPLLVGSLPLPEPMARARRSEPFFLGSPQGLLEPYSSDGFRGRSAPQGNSVPPRLLPLGFWAIPRYVPWTLTIKTKTLLPQTNLLLVLLPPKLPITTQHGPRDRPFLSWPPSFCHICITSHNCPQFHRCGCIPFSWDIP